MTILSFEKRSPLNVVTCPGCGSSWSIDHDHYFLEAPYIVATGSCISCSLPQEMRVAV